MSQHNSFYNVDSSTGKVKVSGEHSTFGRNSASCYLWKAFVRDGAPGEDSTSDEESAYSGDLVSGW